MGLRLEDELDTLEALELLCTFDDALLEILEALLETLEALLTLLETELILLLLDVSEELLLLSSHAVSVSIPTSGISTVRHVTIFIELPCFRKVSGCAAYPRNASTSRCCNDYRRR